RGGHCVAERTSRDDSHPIPIEPLSQSPELDAAIRRVPRCSGGPQYNLPNPGKGGGMPSECCRILKKRGKLGLAVLCCLFLCASTLTFAHQTPPGCTQNRMTLDIGFVPNDFVLQGNNITYTITAQNNPNNLSDACDADHVLVQFCCPSPTGSPFPFG